jgi:hypothetical protein
MNLKYQIVLLDPGRSGNAERLRATLEKRLGEMGLDVKEWVAFLDASTFSQRDPRAPVVGVYFGGTASTDEDTATVQQLLDRQAIVLPVVQTLRGYTSSVPDVLHPVNGLELRPEDPDLEGIAGLVLEALSLLRQTRRLFISYRRAESREAALQIYDLLDERGFDVFLDTHGVRVGEPFQEVLWHRLVDSDMVLLLDTKEFLESQWTQKELAEAHAMSIGILQVIWPDHKRKRFSELAVPHYLEDRHFASPSRLATSALGEIATLLESLRARYLALRHANLVRAFVQAARDLSIAADVQPQRYILATGQSGKKVAVIPAIGVPTALQYQEIADLIDPGKQPVIDKAVLIYDHRGIRDRWITHLRWLDQYLPVKTFRVTEASQWLPTL